MLRRIRPFSLFAVACSIACAACSSSPPTPSPTQQTSQPIINGKPSDAAQDAVVLLVSLDGGLGSCTATLLAPNLILTARHCVSNVQEQPFGCDIKGNLVNFPGTQVGTDHAANRLIVFTGQQRPDFLMGMPKIAASGKKIFHDDSKVLCSHDVSLVLLDKDIPDASIAQIRLDDPIVAGETFTAVGWGYTESGMPNVRMQREGIKVVAVGPNASGPTPPNDFKVGESICSGDSGGPALSTTTNAIIGVVSRGGNGMMDPNNPSVGCTGTTSVNFYTGTPGFKDLILQAFAESGHDPWLEGGPDPRKAKDGEACATGDDCRSAICNQSLCVHDCSSDGVCPMGFDCKAQDGMQICLPHMDPPPAMMPAQTNGCALSPSSSSNGWSQGWWALVAAAFALARRKRRA
jgi:MYXO-CTERM domain-containing protein